MNIEDYKEFVKEKHKGQKRKQGTEYYTHPFRVSELLKLKGFDERYQICGLFHDLLEDTNTTYEELVNISSKEIADATKLVTKEKGYNMEDYISRIKNNDIAHMVKLADRIHNLDEAIYADIAFQNKYIKETEDYYVSLAKDTVFEKDLNDVLERLKGYKNEMEK